MRLLGEAVLEREPGERREHENDGDARGQDAALARRPLAQAREEQHQGEAAGAEPDRRARSGQDRDQDAGHRRDRRPPAPLAGQQHGEGDEGGEFRHEPEQVLVAERSGGADFAVAKPLPSGHHDFVAQDDRHAREDRVQNLRVGARASDDDVDEIHLQQLPRVERRRHGDLRHRNGQHHGEEIEAHGEAERRRTLRLGQGEEQGQRQQVQTGDEDALDVARPPRPVDQRNMRVVGKWKNTKKNPGLGGVIWVPPQPLGGGKDRRERACKNDILHAVTSPASRVGPQGSRRPKRARCVVFRPAASAKSLVGPNCRILSTKQDVDLA